MQDRRHPRHLLSHSLNPVLSLRDFSYIKREVQEVQVGHGASNLSHQIQARRDEATSENIISMAQRLNEVTMDADLPTRNLQHVHHKMKRVVSCKVKIRGTNLFNSLSKRQTPMPPSFNWQRNQTNIYSLTGRVKFTGSTG